MAIKTLQGVQPELRRALDILDNITIPSGLTLPMSAEADLTGGADLGDVIAKVNALLAKLRASGALGV